MCKNALTNKNVFDILFLQVGRKYLKIHKYWYFIFTRYVQKCTRKEVINLINAHKIKTRMFELQLTQEEIAKSMSLDYSTLNAKINNKRRIYADEVAKLCKILKISTSAELREYFGLDFLIDKKCKNAPESE